MIKGYKSNGQWGEIFCVFWCPCTANIPFHHPLIYLLRAQRTFLAFYDVKFQQGMTFYDPIINRKNEGLQWKN